MVTAAVYAVKAVGGMDTLMHTLSTKTGPHGLNYLNILPDFHSNWDLAVAVFVMPIAVQWWSVWYPGAEPGGGSYIAQRMLASKSEKDSLGAVLFFNIAHYVLRPWPWILVALCSLLIYPELSDIQKAFTHLDPKLLGHDIAYPAMLKFLPAGFIGLMVGGLIAANSSTVTAHLNWGSSYLVHDFYRRFIVREGTEKHYVAVGRFATVGLFVCAALLTFFLESAKDTFDIILQVGAGTGLLYLVRWFWWRVTAWCEVVAMVSSFVISIVLLVLNHNHHGLGTDRALLVTIAVTTICWVATACWGRQRIEACWSSSTGKQGLSDPAGGEFARKPASPKAMANGRVKTFRWRCWAGSRAARPSGPRCLPWAIFFTVDTRMRGHYSASLSRAVSRWYML